MLLFGGAVDAMNTTVKNNRNAYKRRTGEIFSTEKNLYIEGIHKGINKGKIATKSKEEIKAFQQEVQELKNRDNRILIFTIVNITLFVCLAAFFYIRYDQERNAALYQEYKEIQLIEATVEYKENMQKGNRHIKKGNWFRAIGYFENALDLIPNDSKAQESLVESYYSFCFYENKGCKKAKLILNDLQQKESNPTLCADLNNKLKMLQSKKK